MDGVDVFDAPFIPENVSLPKLWCKLVRETFPKCLTLESSASAFTVCSLCLYLHCKCTASQSQPWLLKLVVEGFTRSLVCCLGAWHLCAGFLLFSTLSAKVLSLPWSFYMSLRRYTWNAKCNFQLYYFLNEYSNYGTFFGVRIEFQNKFSDVYRVYLEKLES